MPGTWIQWAFQADTLRSNQARPAVGSAAAAPAVSKNVRRPRGIANPPSRRLNATAIEDSIEWRRPMALLFRSALRTRADGAQMIERVDARVVPVVPVDADGVGADFFNGFHAQLGLEHLEWIWGRA